LTGLPAAENSPEGYRKRGLINFAEIILNFVQKAGSGQGQSGDQVSAYFGFNSSASFQSPSLSERSLPSRRGVLPQAVTTSWYNQEVVFYFDCDKLLFHFSPIFQMAHDSQSRTRAQRASGIASKRAFRHLFWQELHRATCYYRMIWGSGIYNP
jgi:hypothetical protein